MACRCFGNFSLGNAVVIVLVLPNIVLLKVNILSYLFFRFSNSLCYSIGHRKGRSLLIEDGVLTWMVANSTRFSHSTTRHIELAFCHLAQNEDNTCDIIASGGIKELLRISRESPRDDARNLAKMALDSNPAFLREVQ